MTDLFVKGAWKVLVEICEGVIVIAAGRKSPMPSPLFFQRMARPWHNTTNKPFQSLVWQRIFHPILTVCHKITLCLVLPTVMFPFAFDCHRFLVLPLNLHSNSLLKPFVIPLESLCNSRQYINLPLNLARLIWHVFKAWQRCTKKPHATLKHGAFRLFVV